MTRSAIIYFIIVGLIVGYMVTQLVFTRVLQQKIWFSGRHFVRHWILAVCGTVSSSAALILVRDFGMVVDLMVLASLYFCMMHFLLGYCALRNQPRPEFVGRLGVAMLGASAAALSVNDAFWMRFVCGSAIQVVVFAIFGYFTAVQLRKGEKSVLSDSVLLLTSGVLCIAATWRLFGAIEGGIQFMRPGAVITPEALRLYLLTLVGIITCGIGLVLGCLERVLAATRHAELHDELTGLANRRAINLAGEREVELALRQGHGLVVALVDIDFFKRVNDEYGHEVGDAVLVETARALAHERRSADLVGRYGGEEFCLVFPGDDRAAVIGQRLVSRLRRHDFASFPRVTVSVGLAVIPVGSDVGSWPELIRQADTALYAAKAGGRNQAVVSPAAAAAAAAETEVPLAGSAAVRGVAAH